MCFKLTFFPFASNDPPLPLLACQIVSAFQVKGPLDTSNFDDFSGVDERFAIHKERHKACEGVGVCWRVG